MERALAADPGLRGELDALTRVRGALQALAESEDAPSGLDARIAPLRRGSGSSWPRRPVRWLAAAAAVVLGVALGVEVLQRSPPMVPAGATVPTSPQAGEDEGTRGSVGGAPSTAADRRVGAASPEAARAGEATRPLIPGAPAPPLRERVGLPLGPAHEAPRTFSVGPGTRTAPAPNQAGEAGGHGDRSGTASKLGRPQSADDGLDGRSSAGGRAAAGRLLVFMGGDTAWQDFEPRVASVPGRHAVRVRIVDGSVRKVWPVWKPLAAPFDSLQASELVVGLAISGVPDGDYAGEVVIEGPSTPPG